MKPSLVSHAPFVVVGIGIVTKPMSPEIPQLWSRFVRREREISSVREPGVTYGVMQMEAGDAGGLSYLAGLSVSDQAVAAPTGMTAVAVPAGQYAVFKFPLSEIGSAFDFILNSWLPSSGYAPIRSPIFERYDEHFNPADPSSELEVHVPAVACANAGDA